MYTRGILFLLLSTVVFACSDSKPEEENVDLGYNYFPTQTGATWLYNVDSLVYDDNSGQTTIDTFTFQYKEQITGSFTDVTGEPAQQVSRFFRYSDTLPWTVLNQSTQMRTALNAQRVQENIRYVKLVFPLERNKRWNGNLYNTLGTEQYTVSYVDQASTVGNTSYPLTVKVQQQNEVNAIEEIIRYEIYARNIGLVYALSDSLNTQVSGSRGYRYRFTLLTYTP
ncbi:MAG: hypothetical protein V4590_04775 [Bacteroidota bacterium]